MCVCASLSHTYSLTAVAAPGHPEQGAFYVLKGLLKVIADYQWEKNSTAKSRISIGVLALLSSLAQPKLLYHTSGVDGNDTLYGLSPDYMEVCHHHHVVFIHHLRLHASFFRSSHHT